MYIWNFGFATLLPQNLLRIVLLFSSIFFISLTLLDKLKNKKFIEEMWFSVSESRETNSVVLVKVLVTAYATMLFSMLLRSRFHDVQFGCESASCIWKRKKVESMLQWQLIIEPLLEQLYSSYLICSSEQGL